MRHSFTYMKLRMISRANVLIFLEKASLNVIEFLFNLSKITDYYDKIFIINDLKAQKEKLAKKKSRVRGIKPLFSIPLRLTKSISYE